ncbi:MAG: hypothetical protein JOZ24_00590, partial [Candidatus Eremiobacteraeota bacterium]|nr:hypothetical protein [Candidatus Eremiobacteraeota bacterium]
MALLALSACAHAEGGSLPGAADRALIPEGSTVAFESATLWAAYDLGSTRVFSANAGGVPPLKHTYGGFSWPGDAGAFPGGSDVAAAPDGTGWILLRHSAIEESRDWLLVALAPNERDPGRPENTYAGNGYPLAFALGGDGVLVESIDVTTAAPAIIRTYPYAANMPAPLRTFTVPAA